MGLQFKDIIRDRYNASDALPPLLSWASTAAGKEVVASFLASHSQTYPLYVEELRGIAEGSGLPFETIFINNLVEELQNFAPAATGTTKTDRFRSDHCSDYVLHTPSSCVIGHNEDNARSSFGHTFLANVTIDGQRFVAYVYGGDLPTGAFGWVPAPARIAFTLNWVHPPRTVRGGLGRGFLSRDLLAATSLEDGIRRITRPEQAAGHNTQIMDVATCGDPGATRVYNVETGPYVYSVRGIPAAPPGSPESAFFHANEYATLKLPGQTISNSSAHRVARVEALPLPRTKEEVLAVLGDQGDRSWPIFHDDLSHRRGDLSDWTLTTALFDCGGSASGGGGGGGGGRGREKQGRGRGAEPSVTIYRGNPKHGDVERVMPLLW